MTKQKALIYAFLFLFLIAGNLSGVRSNVVPDPSRCLLQVDFFVDQGRFTEANSCKKWKVRYDLLSLKKYREKEKPQPISGQYFSSTKRKGITAKAPELSLPAFTGFFPGFASEIGSGICPSAFPLISSYPGSTQKIRPPPAK